MSYDAVISRIGYFIHVGFSQVSAVVTRCICGLAYVACWLNGCDVDWASVICFFVTADLLDCILFVQFYHTHNINVISMKSFVNFLFVTSRIEPGCYCFH